MNHIEQAYQQGVLIRCKGWSNDEWIKKHSDTKSIDDIGDIWSNDYWDFETNPNNWEIYHEDLPLLKDQPDIKAQIQTHLNQIQELLKQL